MRAERTLTAYDVRQLHTMRAITEQVLRNLAWMKEQSRSATERELRAMYVSGSTAYVSQLAKNFERRFAAHPGGSGE